MAKNKNIFTFAAIVFLVLLLTPILGINAHAEGIDNPGRTQNDEPSDVVINPADEMPDPNADEAPEVVIVDEDVPIGDNVNQDNVANVWLIVGISVGAVAVLGVVVAIIVSKARAKK
ncbi:MAG: hypothetical protein IJS71_01760 [Clostridia bacterium]|nr:hypothetical protein [Clostridia bacterium]